MNQALPIGFFQFDNLIKNRVPFFLLRTSLPIESAYGVIERLHLRNYSLIIEKMALVEAQNALAERATQKHDPIVVLCEQGADSEKVAQELVVAGFLNVYFILGGWKSIESEIQADK